MIVNITYEVVITIDEAVADQVKKEIHALVQKHDNTASVEETDREDAE